MQSARNSSRMLEETLATGVAILSKYSEQRDRLKVLSDRPDSLLYVVYGIEACLVCYCLEKRFCAGDFSWKVEKRLSVW